jgi:UDP-2,3-diacylglucosamine pyrophosphatase LpxH
MECKGIIIIPDVHGRRFWKPAVQKYASELTSDQMHCVFLGDYLDPYEFEQQQEMVGSTTDVINNFKEILKIKEALGSSVTLLLGNHDLHYIDEYEPDGWRCRYMYDK